MYGNPWLTTDLPLASQPGAYCTARRPSSGLLLYGEDINVASESEHPDLPLSHAVPFLRRQKVTPPCTHLIEKERPGAKAKAKAAPTDVFFAINARFARLASGTTQHPSTRSAAGEAEAHLLRTYLTMSEGVTSFVVYEEKKKETVTVQQSELLCVVASLLSPNSLLFVTEEDVYLVVLQDETAKRHVVSAACHGSGAESVARCWQVNSLSLGRFSDILLIASAVKRRRTLTKLRTHGLERVFCSTETLESNAAFCAPPMETLLFKLRSLGDFCITFSEVFCNKQRWVLLCDKALSFGSTAENPNPKTKQKLPLISGRIPYTCFKNATVYDIEITRKAEKSDTIFVLCVQLLNPIKGNAKGGFFQSIDATKVAAAVHSCVKQYFALRGRKDDDSADECLCPLTKSTLHEGGVVTVGPFSSTAQKERVVARLRTAFLRGQGSPLHVHKIGFAEGSLGGDGEYAQLGSVATEDAFGSQMFFPFNAPSVVNHMDNAHNVTLQKDGPCIKWGRYMLSNNMDRLLTALSGLEASGGHDLEYGFWATSFALVQACACEGLIPSLLTESLALEIRQKRGLQTLSVEANESPSLPSLILTAYAGVSLAEWGLGVMYLILKEVVDKGFFFSLAKPAYVDRVKQYVAYVVRGITLCERDRTVPPEVRIVCAAIKYSCDAVSFENAADTFVTIFGTFLMDRGFGALLDDPARCPVEGDFEVLSKVLRAVLTQRLFTTKDGPEYVALNDWVEAQCKDITFVYSTLCNPNTMPAGAVCRPGVPRSSRASEVARLTGKLADAYQTPALLLPAWAPLVKCIQENSFELLLNAWCMEDIMGADMVKKNDLLRSVRNYDL